MRPLTDSCPKPLLSINGKPLIVYHIEALKKAGMTVIEFSPEDTKAYLDMAERTNVEEMAAFANVILQAGQYGTSISKALTTYADEMRVARELRAQEKANRLPVQMSGVIAVMMMPVLLIICLAPMLIRWSRMFG